MQKAIPLPSFPVEKISSLDFGSADGHKDEVAMMDASFIYTSSVNTFLKNKHSIVVGAIGAGKSTLFRLLKEKSLSLENYRELLIIPIEEIIQIDKLRDLGDNIDSRDHKNDLYQVVWKINILVNISRFLSKEEGFPRRGKERSVAKFLDVYGFSNRNESVLDLVISLIQKANIKIEAKISDNTISLGGRGCKKVEKINLDFLENALSESIENRFSKKALVIIDKIDKFVAGVDYKTQVEFISSLLDVDDSFSGNKNIDLKIFLRKDLFERLDFSRLGFDKVNDNVVNLKWNQEEVVSFVARRISYALINSNIVTGDQLLSSISWDEIGLNKAEKWALNRNIPDFLKRFVIFLFNKKNLEEREISLFSKIDI